MDSSLPVIQHPKTPSPPTIVETSIWDDNHNEHVHDGLLSPNSAYFPRRASPSSLTPSSSSRRPDTNRGLLRPPSPSPSMASDDDFADANGSAAPAHNPFNFQTQVISTSPIKSNIGQRRGHRYKHSSISAQHQIFQEPPPRAPPVLPASLPVPTLKEAWASMHRDQRARLYWCLCHTAVAVFVFFSASGSLAMTALSHLVSFDVGSAAVCVAVDVLGNFEVWRRSSVRHPFGLQRAEVLAGFATSIFLVFGGFDLISHNMKHLLESVGNHEPHTAHSHGGSGRSVSPGAIDTASLAAVVSTLISAYGLKNHARIRRVMRVQYPSYLSSLLPGVLANPFHFLTLFFSFVMLLLPLLSIAVFVWLDALICAAIAVSMFLLGMRLAVAQGLMLLMSYSGAERSNDMQKDGSVSAVVHEIEAEPSVRRVDEAQFWQVHYGLCMANLKISVVRGCDDSTLSQLRVRIARMVQNRLGEGYGRGQSLKWEVTTQTTSEGS